MGSCIKALITGSRREEFESQSLHSPSKSRCYQKRVCRPAKATNVASGVSKPKDDTSAITYSRQKTRRPINIELSDINSANYHQLCVLAKISANQAKAIVNYRVSECGGQFHSIEQLLDIPGSGVTREKLGISDPGSSTAAVGVPTVKAESIQMKLEKQNDSDIGSMATLDFINSANCHQLCALARINTTQAESIIKYRIHECGGRFSNIGQLLDVHNGGISPEKLQFIINSSKGQCHSKPYQPPRKKQTKHKPLNFPESPAKFILPESPAKFTLPVGVLHFGEDTSPTPKRKLFSGTNENSVIRICSWNLECFTTSKVSNAGVLEVVCMTILMNGLDIIAFQELGDDNAIKKVCEELNHPTLTKVQSWPSRMGKWKCIVSEKTGRMFQGMEYSAFLWNESTGIRYRSSGLLGKQKGSDDQFFVRKPFIGTFKAADWTFVLINVHIKSAGWSGEHTDRVIKEIRLLAPLVQATNESVNGKEDVILLGDFNKAPDNSCFGQLVEATYIHLFPASEPTNISAVNPKGNRSYDNVWITTQLSRERYTGQCKVVRRGLQHELIEGKKPGTKGTVSDHCPIWVAFRANRSKS